ncbi:MAG TPA: putative metal-binding motif-containing protein [Sandaracinaceae bacterium]
MMKPLGTTLVLALAIGCSNAAPQDAGATPRDATSDTTVQTRCERDRDCDDGLFCTGIERCRPDEADADARGCLSLPPPCDPSECNEESARCEICPIDTRDMGQDGYDATACGGTDCDDGDPTINPGATEICDVTGIDEDCRADTWGDDDDEDGYFAVDCCYRSSGGELTCGADCDDRDPTVNIDAIERCNAVDDDCDEMIDEIFDCAQNETAVASNACGRPASRRCSATCE